MTVDPRPSPVQIDVGRLVQRSVASLYSSLVTRPTGRAVRLAIETQLAEVGETTMSVIDLTEVTVLDFSCADEVVAKLLMRYLSEDRPRNAFFIFRGVGEEHRDPVEAVLERQSLAAVAQRRDGLVELLGSGTEDEIRAWGLVEEHGRVPASEVAAELGEGGGRAVERIVQRRLVFPSRESSELHALSRLARDLV